MKQKISSILILVVFFSLQYGKVATYLYCKFQAEIVQNKPDCGCNDHLVAMYDHHDDDSSNSDLSKSTVNEKLNEFTPKTVVEIQPFVISFPNCFTEYNAELSENFPDSPFHPPIA